MASTDETRGPKPVKLLKSLRYQGGGGGGTSRRKQKAVRFSV